MDVKLNNLVQVQRWYNYMSTMYKNYSGAAAL